tara:strand:- start:1509 stop:1757 length:249 start_codon:yes stop_codon:yes gene_type:complete
MRFIDKAKIINLLEKNNIPVTDANMKLSYELSNHDFDWLGCVDRLLMYTGMATWSKIRVLQGTTENYDQLVKIFRENYHTQE